LQRLEWARLLLCRQRLTINDSTRSIFVESPTVWKRNDDNPPAQPAPPPVAQPSNRTTTERTAPAAETPTEHVAVIGPLVVFKGELTGSEDLNINGQVEGTINLPLHLLTIGPNGQIKAHVTAKSVVVVGHITGNITATEKLEIRENGSVEGDITSPSVAIAEGGKFRGSVDMQQSRPAAEAATPADPASSRTGGVSSGAASATGRPSRSSA
jgi:cytoskeletal protein CcmA (bactofilin family)